MDIVWIVYPIVCLINSIAVLDVCGGEYEDTY